MLKPYKNVRPLETLFLRNTQYDRTILSQNKPDPEWGQTFQ